LTKILDAFPEINAEWLLAGKGDMLKLASGDADDNATALEEPKSAPSKSPDPATILYSIILERNENLIRENERLKAENVHLKTEVDRLKIADIEFGRLKSEVETAAKQSPQLKHPNQSIIYPQSPDESLMAAEPDAVFIPQ
jgi:hypothetical protein